MPGADVIYTLSILWLVLYFAHFNKISRMPDHFEPSPRVYFLIHYTLPSHLPVGHNLNKKIQPSIKQPKKSGELESDGQ